MMKMPAADSGAPDFWEDLYGQRDRIWSGRANTALVDVADGLAAGRALDLGSGEGGDSLWLAEHGWQVTGIDIAPTALARSAAEAESRGLDAGRIRWVEADLATWEPAAGEEYDLVSACFLHAPAELHFPRIEVLRRAAGAVAPGGLLLVVGHAEFPRWSRSEEEPEGDHGTHHRHDDHDEVLPSADEVAEALALPADEWTTLVSEPRRRQAVGPDGQEAELVDAVLLVQRVPA